MNRDPRRNKAIENMQRQLRGKKSKAAGGYFENMISRACTYYRDKNIAYIEKTPEPMKVLKPMPKQPGRFIACFVKAAQPDYKGTIQGGRAIVFEAKHTEGSKIDRSRLTAEQMRCLEKHSKLGAHAFVIVSFGLRRFFRIPWPVWRDMKKIYGRQYLKLDELSEYEITAQGGVIRLLEGII